jgi:hypothetical protein
MDKEIQDMLNDLPNKKFSKLSDKQLSAIEYTRNLNIENGHYQKNSKAALGKKRTEEQKKKLSENRKGREISEEGKKNMSIGAKNRKVPSILIGKKRTEEEKKKISENRKGKGIGRIMTDEHKKILKKVCETKFLCPHCNREIGGRANFVRYHNDNCKNKI